MTYGKGRIYESQNGMVSYSHTVFGVGALRLLAYRKLADLAIEMLY